MLIVNVVRIRFFYGREESLFTLELVEVVSLGA